MNVAVLLRPKNIALTVTEPAGAIEAIVPDLLGGKTHPPATEADIVQSTLVAVVVPMFLIIALIPIPNTFGTVIVRVCCAGAADTGKTSMSSMSIVSNIPAFNIFFLFIFLFSSSKLWI